MLGYLLVGIAGGFYVADLGKKISYLKLGTDIGGIGLDYLLILFDSLGDLALLDQQNESIHFPYAYGDEELIPMKMGEGITSRILRTGEPLLINQDVVKHSEEIGANIKGREALSYLGVPITAMNA